MLLPGGVINGLMSPVAGRLFDKFGPRALITPGLLIVIITLWFMRGLETTTSTGVVIGLHIALLVGISLVMMPGQTTGLNQLPRQLYPHGTAIMNTLQQVSGAIGTALFISIYSSGQARYLASSANPKDPGSWPRLWSAACTVLLPSRCLSASSPSFSVCFCAGRKRRRKHTVPGRSRALNPWPYAGVTQVCPRDHLRMVLRAAFCV